MLNRDPNRLPAISPELLRADQIARTIARRPIARPPRAIANDASDEAMLADVEHFDARTGALLHSLEAEVADLDARGCDHQNMIQNNHTDWVGVCACGLCLIFGFLCTHAYRAFKQRAHRG